MVHLAVFPPGFIRFIRMVLHQVFKENKHVIFTGNGYSAEWPVEANKRGLPNLNTTPKAVATWNSDKNKYLGDKIHQDSPSFFLKANIYIYIWCCFLLGGWEGRRGEKSKKRLVRFISTEFWLWPMESWDHKMKDEDYEDDMFLECGSWKDLRSSWKYDEQGRSELMVKTTRERGRNNLTIWSLMISRFVPFWLRRKLFETLKIYTAEETEARQEALRLRMLFFLPWDLAWNFLWCQVMYENYISSLCCEVDPWCVK